MTFLPSLHVSFSLFFPKSFNCGLGGELGSSLFYTSVCIHFILKGRGCKFAILDTHLAINNEASLSFCIPISSPTPEAMMLTRYIITNGKSKNTLIPTAEKQAA